MFNYGHWVSNTKQLPSHKAFVYIIKNKTTNHFYIGKKTIDKKNLWHNYCSSSKQFADKVKMFKNGYLLEIITFCTKPHSSYYEMILQVHYIENILCLNKLIHYRGTAKSAKPIRNKQLIDMVEAILTK